MITLSASEKSALEVICKEADLGLSDTYVYDNLVKRNLAYKTLGGFYRATKQGLTDLQLDATEIHQE